MTKLPQENHQLFGHEAVEKQLAGWWHEGVMPHALLLAGPEGIGKATLAYRLVRTVLSGHGAAGEEDASMGLFGDALPQTLPEHLEIDDAMLFQAVATAAHPNLKIINATSQDEDGKMVASSQIRVWQIRDLNALFSQTSGQEGWRVVVIDAAEDMNRNAANALLKLLEEPPVQTLFILISHEPGSLLPTIISRCRMVKMLPLGQQALRHAVQAECGDEAVSDEAMRCAMMLSDGAPGRAITWFHQGIHELFDEVSAALAAGHHDEQVLFKLAESFARKQDNERWNNFLGIAEFLLRHLASYHAGVALPEEVAAENLFKHRVDSRHIVPCCSLYEQVLKLGRQVEGLYLDRKSAGLELLLTWRSNLILGRVDN